MKEKKLLKIIEPYKKIKTGKHNCIVPISGGKDSYFIVDYVKNTLNMHPLVVYHNIHYNTLLAIIIYQIFNLRWVWI